MTRSAAQIRSEFIEFFRERGHTPVPGSPVVPLDDPTLLFTNAGMNQFKPIFLGTADRGSEFGRLKRAANSQPCIRAGGKHNDLDDVGHDTYHHTFFEMLGNWSFGDYFKKEAIEWAWELITQVWKLDPERLHATYFGGDAAENLSPDEEARELWRRFLPPDRIHPGDKKDNFWEMGDTGPCGPCSELHIDLTPDKSGGKLVNAGDERVIEFWNLVFIQFNRGADGRLTPLPAKHVDTGMGFERITRLIQGKRSNYDIDVFTPIFEAIQRVSGAAAYGGRLECDLTGTGALGGASVPPASREELMRDVAYRVIADHIRTLTFALADGAAPDKEGRGYVLRRILRRAVRYGWQYLGLHEPFLCKLVDTVVATMGDAFPRLREKPGRVVELIRDEEVSFARTLARGIALFEEAAERATRDHHGEIQGDDAFRLHDTFGFPIDLTEIMARERGLRVDIGEYERLMEEARERARRGSSNVDILSELLQIPEEYLTEPTDDRAKFEVRAIEATYRFPTGVRDENDDAWTSAGLTGLVFDKTCFYAEQGGQVGDEGQIQFAGRPLLQVKTTKRSGDIVIHLVDPSPLGGGISIRPGEQAILQVAEPKRRSTMRNHTATHLLNWALRDVLDPRCEHLQQKGSLVDPEKTRFDFSHPKAVSPEELERIESLVTARIRENLPVYAAEAPIADARRINTLRAVFGEKYPDNVRVVSIGVPVEKLLKDPARPEWMGYSVEFCGGTHVKATAEIEAFALVSEEAVAKGVRRVVGVSGEAARKAIDAGARLLSEAQKLAKYQPDQLAAALPQLQKAIETATLRVADRAKLRAAVAELQETVKRQQKAAATAAAGSALGMVDALLAGATRAGNTAVVVAELSDVSIDALKTAADAIKQKAGSAAIFFGQRAEGRATLLAAVTDDLVKRGVKAGDWVKAIAPLVEGGGGGSPTMAQAGGKRPEKLEEALRQAQNWILARTITAA